MHTINDMLDRYEREELHNLAERTRKDYIRHIPVLREKYGSRDVLADIRQDVIDYVTAPGRGRVHRMRQLAVFRSAFTYALKWKWISANPLAHIEKPLPKTRTGISFAEFDKLVQFAKKYGHRGGGARLALAMELALRTGRRQADVLGLTWDRVDLPAGVMRFRQPRSKKWVEIKITPEIQQLLECAKKLDPAAKQGGRSKHVVSNRAGQGYTSEGFRAGYQRMMKRWKATGRDGVQFHDIKQLSDKVAEESRTDAADDPADDFPQFPQNLKDQATWNAPYYKVMFCLERMIRERITGVLEKALGPDWWDKANMQQNVRNDAKNLMERERDRAITQRSERMIDYTTLGQLGEIIRENWTYFKDVYQSEKAVSNVIANLNLVRGPIAHCCQLSTDEAERLRLYVHDWFARVERR